MKRKQTKEVLLESQPGDVITKKVFIKGNWRVIINPRSLDYYVVSENFKAKVLRRFFNDILYVIMMPQNASGATGFYD